MTIRHEQKGPQSSLCKRHTRLGNIALCGEGRPRVSCALLVHTLLRTSSAMATLQKYQTELIEHGMAVGALKFGTFTLKSGRFVVLHPHAA